jgi:hypothetical protein
VLEAAGKTWLLGHLEIYVLQGDRPVEVGPIPQDVIAVWEEHGRVIAMTYTGVAPEETRPELRDQFGYPESEGNDVTL